jgi:hypothetical protein
MREASRRFKAGQATDALAVFTSAMRKMLEPTPKELQQKKEVPNIVVKHKQKKNKTASAGSIVLGFDSHGIALVPDVGSNRSDVEAYCRHSNGLAEIVDTFEVRTTTIPASGSTPRVDLEEIKKGSTFKEIKHPEADEAVEEKIESKQKELDLPDEKEEPKAKKKPVGKKG